MIIIGANKDEIEIINRVLDKFKNFEYFASKLKSIEVIDSFCNTELITKDKYVYDEKETLAYIDINNKTILMSNLKHIGIYMKKYNINCEINTFYEDIIAHEFGHLWYGILEKNNDGVRKFLLDYAKQQHLNDNEKLVVRAFIHEVFAVTFQRKLHSKRGLNMQLSDKILFETRKKFKKAFRLQHENPGYHVNIETVSGEFTLHKNDKMYQEQCS